MTYFDYFLTQMFLQDVIVNYVNFMKLKILKLAFYTKKVWNDKDIIPLVVFFRKPV